MLVGRALIFCVVFYIFYLCLSLVAKARTNQELHNNLMVLERVRQAQEEYYHMLVANCESTQRLQHDIRHHGLAMKALADSQLEKPALPLELKLVTKGNMLLLSVINPCLDNIKETP